MKRPQTLDLLVRVSRLYYLNGKSQAEIARLLRVSRPGVSRLLKRARSEGVVEIKIRGGGTGGDHGDLAKRLGLDELVVSPDRGLSAAGAAAAGWFARTVRARDGIGLTAGTTLASFVRSVDAARDLDLEIVPLVGSLWDTGQDYDGSFLCQELRGKTGGVHRVLSAPAIVRTASLARALRAEPRVRAVLARYGALRYAIFGIGTALPRHPLAGAAGAHAVAARVIPPGAVANVGCLFFGEDGRPIRSAIDRRTIGITHAELAAVPQRVALAAGAAKLAATLALIRGHRVNILIVDSVLAALLKRSADTLQLPRKSHAERAV